MKPGRYDIEMVRGDDYDLLLPFQDAAGVAIPLTGRTYKAQVREHPDAGALADFAVDTTGLAAGNLTISLPRAITATLPRSLVWDLQETGTNGKVRTILAGSVSVTRDVTR